MEKIAKLAVFLAIGMAYPCAPASAQTGIAGVIELSENPSTDSPGPDAYSYSNQAFALEFKQLKGERLAAYGSDRGAWSVATIPVDDGGRTVQCPILASVKSSEGSHMTVLPAVLTFKVSIDAGKKAHLGGYLISTGRSVKTGDSIAVFVLSGVAVLSVEAAEPKSGGSAEPWFTAFKEDAKPSIDPAAAVKVWRVEKEYVRR